MSTETTIKWIKSCLFTKPTAPFPDVPPEIQQHLDQHEANLDALVAEVERLRDENAKQWRAIEKMAPAAGPAYIPRWVLEALEASE